MRSRPICPYCSSVIIYSSCQACGGGRRRVDDPTEEEIAAAAAKIRERWSAEEKLRRAGVVERPVEIKRFQWVQ